MLSTISTFILKLFGWKISGNHPGQIKKFVSIAITHTSNWDLPVGLLTKGATRLNIQWVGKASLFRFPLGYIFRALGGIPVDRSKSNNFVDSIVQLFNSREELIIFMAPEGTRRKVNKLKTGFYYIAKEAKVPIVMIRLDFAQKDLIFSDPFYPTDNKEEDFQQINAFFKGAVGKNKEWSWEETGNGEPR